jgi:hypothetical protein
MSYVLSLCRLYAGLAKCNTVFVKVEDPQIYKKMCAKMFMLTDIWRFREPKVTQSSFKGNIHEICSQRF